MGQVVPQSEVVAFERHGVRSRALAILRPSVTVTP